MELLLDSYKIRHLTNYRKGQAFFNCLEDFRPDLAALIRGTEIDPFYDDSKVDAAIEYVVERWE